MIQILQKGEPLRFGEDELLTLRASRSQPSMQGLDFFGLLPLPIEIEVPKPIPFYLRWWNKVKVWLMSVAGYLPGKK
jgi:hypothetical protein